MPLMYISMDMTVTVILIPEKLSQLYVTPEQMTKTHLPTVFRLIAILIW